MSFRPSFQLRRPDPPDRRGPQRDDLYLDPSRHVGQRRLRLGRAGRRGRERGVGHGRVGPRRPLKLGQRRPVVRRVDRPRATRSTLGLGPQRHLARRRPRQRLDGQRLADLRRGRALGHRDHPDDQDGLGVRRGSGLSGGFGARHLRTARHVTTANQGRKQRREDLREGKDRSRPAGGGRFPARRSLLTLRRTGTGSGQVGDSVGGRLVNQGVLSAQTDGRSIVVAPRTLRRPFPLR